MFYGTLLKNITLKYVEYHLLAVKTDVIQGPENIAVRLVMLDQCVVPMCILGLHGPGYIVQCTLYGVQCTLYSRQWCSGRMSKDPSPAPGNHHAWGSCTTFLFKLCRI